MLEVSVSSFLFVDENQRPSDFVGHFNGMLQDAQH